MATLLPNPENWLGITDQAEREYFVHRQRVAFARVICIPVFMRCCLVLSIAFTEDSWFTRAPTEIKWIHICTVGASFAEFYVIAAAALFDRSTPSSADVVKTRTLAQTIYALDVLFIFLAMWTWFQADHAVRVEMCSHVHVGVLTWAGIACGVFQPCLFGQVSPRVALLTLAPYAFCVLDSTLSSGVLDGLLEPEHPSRWAVGLWSWLLAAASAAWFVQDRRARATSAATSGGDTVGAYEPVAQQDPAPAKT